MLWIENNVVQFPVPHISEEEPWSGRREVDQQKINWAAVEESDEPMASEPRQEQAMTAFTYMDDH